MFHSDITWIFDSNQEIILNNVKLIKIYLDTAELYCLKFFLIILNQQSKNNLS